MSNYSGVYRCSNVPNTLATWIDVSRFVWTKLSFVVLIMLLQAMRHLLHATILLDTYAGT